MPVHPKEEDFVPGKRLSRAGPEPRKSQIFQQPLHYSFFLCGNCEDVPPSSSRTEAVNPTTFATSPHNSLGYMCAILGMDFMPRRSLAEADKAHFTLTMTSHRGFQPRVNSRDSIFVCSVIYDSGSVLRRAFSPCETTPDV